MQPKEIVTQFIQGIKSQHFDQAKQLLHVDGFEYIGPNMYFTDPEDMLAYLFGMAGIQKDIVVREIATGDEHEIAFEEEAYAQELVQTSHDAQEGVAAFRERRQPEFKGW